MGVWFWALLVPNSICEMLANADPYHLADRRAFDAIMLSCWIGAPMKLYLAFRSPLTPQEVPDAMLQPNTLRLCEAFYVSAAILVALVGAFFGAKKKMAKNDSAGGQD